MNQNIPLHPSLLEQNSPLHQAQQSLQTYFKNLTPEITQLLPLQHGFQEKPSSKHICTRNLRTDQIYFRCKQCCLDQGYFEMIFCFDCFDPKLHEGHQYQQKKVKNFDRCTCDCGRIFLVKPSSMCANHSPSSEKVIEIKQEDQVKFKQYFLELFKIFFFLRDKLDKKLPIYQKLQKLISQTLIKLCENSLYYVRLTQTVLQSQIKVGNEERKILQFLDEHHSFVELFRIMLGDRQFVLPFGEYFLKLEQEHNINQFHMGVLRNQLLNSPIFLQARAKTGIYFPEVIQNYFKIALDNKDQNQRNIQIEELLKNLSEKADSEQFIDALFNLLREGDKGLIISTNFTQHIFKNVINYYKRPQPKIQIKEEKKEQKIEQKKQEQKKQTQKKQQEQNSKIEKKQVEKVQEKAEEKVEQKVEQVKKLSKQEKIRLKKCISVLCRILLSKCGERIQKLQQIMQQQIYKNEQTQNRIEYMIELLIQNDEFMSLKRKKLREVMLFVLMILNRHPKKLNLLLKVWNCVIEEQRTFNQNLDNVYDLVGFLCNSYRNFNILGTNQSEIYYKMSQKQLKQYLLKCYLYERKQVSKSSLWADFCFGWLNFDSCGTILNQLCEYNNGHDTFIYKTNSQVFANKVMKLPDETSTNWQNVRGMGINYNSQCYCQSKTLRNIILTLFKSQQFFNILQVNFIKGLGIAEKQARTLERWKQRGVGQNYVLLLVIIDKVCNGEENQIIKQQIQKIKLNVDEYRFRFTQIGNEQKVKQILCVQPQIPQPIPQDPQNNIQKDQRSAEQVQRQQIKKRSQLKRKKIEQKLKNKRKNMLQKLKRESSVAQEQQQNICFFCKEKEKKDNQFVVLVNLTIDNLISKILHAEQSKTQFKLSTNLHLLHLECYKKFNKKGVQLTCPVCKESINCFLPFKPNRASKRHLEICWNVMNAALVCSHNVYQTGCLFSVLLNSLVQNLGFNELIQGKKSRNNSNFKKNVDKFLLETLTCLFSLSEQQQRQKYRKIVKQFKQRIKTCKRVQLKLFQMVILQAIFFRISGEEQISPDHVENLAKIMIQQQLKILKNTLEFITQGNSQALSSLQGIELSKISEQAMGQNQQKTEQKISEITSIQNIEQKITSSIQIQQKQTERKVLGINLVKLPKKLSQLMSPKFLKGLNCTKCSSADCQSSQIQILCLVCHQGFCAQCYPKNQQHAKTHMNNFITINLKTTQLTVIKHNQNREVFFLYLNPFMIEFKGEDQRVSNNDDQSSADQFQLVSLNSTQKNKKVSASQRNKKFQHRLNQKKYVEITDKFYSLQ